MKRLAMGLLAATLWAAGGASAQAGCVPWKEASSIIAKNSLIPGNVIYKMVQARTGGKIISASLCEQGGRFFYKIVVLGPKGDVINLTVDAATGQF